MTRRGFMAGMAGVVGTAVFRDIAWAGLQKLDPQIGGPEDEAFWAEVRKQFVFHDRMISFNHVGLSPSPESVRTEMEKQYHRAATIPTQIVWREQIKEIDTVRERLAKFIGAKPEETALTYNATYGLQTGIMGWPLQKEDAIITSSHDYSRTFTAIKQRVLRDGVELIEVPVDVPPVSKEQLIENWKKALKPNVKLAVFCTVTFLNGQILPVQELVQLCHERGISVLIDGAQSIALLPTEFGKWQNEMYTACLHKWLMAPVATGVFAAKENVIEKIWSLSPSEESLAKEIKKFEQVGTRQLAPILAVHKALDFHEWLGMDLKFKRIEYLRKKLVDKFSDSTKYRLYGNSDSTSTCAMVALGFRSKGCIEVSGSLATDYGIHVTTAIRGGVDAIRISPNVFTSLAEIDKLADSIRKIVS